MNFAESFLACLEQILEDICDYIGKGNGLQ